MGSETDRTALRKEGGTSLEALTGTVGVQVVINPP